MGKRIITIIDMVQSSHLTLELGARAISYIMMVNHDVDVPVEQSTVCRTTSAPDLSVCSMPEATPLQPLIDETSQPENQEPPKEKKKKRRAKVAPLPQADNVVAEQPICPVSTSFGYKTRAEFRQAFERVKDQVYANMFKRITSVLYPSVCTRESCSLCVSWYISSAITPCHKKFGCEVQCEFGYNAHTTARGLRYLKRYHSQIHTHPIHAVDPPDGPEYETSLVASDYMAGVYEDLPPSLRVIIRTSQDTRMISRSLKASGTPVEPCSDSSESDMECKSEYIPFKTKRKASSRSSNSSSGVKPKIGRKVTS